MSKFSRIFTLRYAFFILIFTLYLFPVRWTNAQSLDTIDTIDKTQFLDSNEFYDEKSDTVKVLYTYEKQPDIDTSNFIFDEYGNSNTEKISDTQFKIYSAVILTRENNEIKQIDHGITELDTWQALQVETLEDKIIKLWTSPFANAQTYYTNAGDGYVGGACTSCSWSSLHDSSSQTASYISENPPIAAEQYASTNYQIYRIFLPFDTSGLADTGYNIDAVSLFFTIQSNGFGNATTSLITTTQESNTTLTGTDFDNVGTEKQAPDLIVANGNNVEYEFELNDFEEINLTGYSHYGLRIADDISNTAPAVGRVYYAVWASESSGTDYDPYLSITLSEEEQGTSTATSSYELGATSTNLAIITSWTEDGMTYYYVPFLIWLLFAIIGLFIFNRLLIEFLIRWRKS